MKKYYPFKYYHSFLCNLCCILSSFWINCSLTFPDNSRNFSLVQFLHLVHLIVSFPIPKPLFTHLWCFKFNAIWKPMISLLDLTGKKKVDIRCLQNSAKPYLTASNCLGLSTLMGPETPASVIQPWLLHSQLLAYGSVDTSNLLGFPPAGRHTRPNSPGSCLQSEQRLNLDPPWSLSRLDFTRQGDL